MSDFSRFHYKTLDDLLVEARRLGVELPVSDNLSILAEPVQFGRRTVPNRFAVQPMEGCDGLADGSPSELTIRRYERFAAGGPGLIWLEACAVVPEGRANPRQIWLHRGSLPAFVEMVRRSREAAKKAGVADPMLVLQLTHSGRYSRPGKRPSPIIAHHSAVLDPRHKLPPDYPLISDDELDRLQERYVESAKLAADAGFDGVDIKSCHRYLFSELLAGFTRTGSRYGGESFENRTRMLRETFARVHAAVGDRIEVTSRLNAYDAIEYPYGWGVDRKELKCDLSEPIKLIGQLVEAGLGGIDITIANPYFNPHINRPADWSIANWPSFPEHPLTGVGRILDVVRQLQQALPKLPVIGSGTSWLRHFLPQVSAGLVRAGWVTIVGVGRAALAYPDFASDILRRGRMDRLKVCVTCSSCTQIMRDGGRSGCVIRDPEIYAPIFKLGRHRDPDTLRTWAAECRDCTDPNCVAGCPAGINIPEFLRAVADGEFRKAYQVLRRSNLLPEICGAVCPVEVQCQGQCIGNHIADRPVQIAEIQRHVSQMAVDNGWAVLDVPEKSSGREMAVVGAGPAGLTAAARLIELGHRVTIFERSARPGGKMLSVIPAHRLPRDEADGELAALFSPVDGDRLRWRLNTALGPDYDLADLRAEGFDAVLLAFGLGNVTGLSRLGGRPEGVIDANAFLTQMNNNPDHRVAGSVAVVGGGNTAVDAAVTAALRGGRDVYLIYRRSYAQMPAWPRERDEALHAGVHLLPFVQPIDFVVDGAGRASGLKLRRTELGEPDADGRRKPVELPGSDFVMNFDLIIEAMGEQTQSEVTAVLHKVNLVRDGRVKVDSAMMTDQPGVFAAGDLVNGGTTVVQAIAEGVRAANAMNEYVAATIKEA
jgi:NADPH-dependent glutamate synthase beta subunit-like oxidoreductase/2,4-dienoyl-CoA reductase-like NADH-dependent reductase (Old Yellow Enzyme family)